MSKGICCSFFIIIIIVEAGAICNSCEIAPGYQAFVVVNIKDLSHEIYALIKHAADI